MAHVGTRLLVALVLAVGGSTWLVNSNPWSGPVVWRLSSSHGVHLNDWLGVACWAMAVVALRRPSVVRSGQAGASLSTKTAPAEGPSRALAPAMLVASPDRLPVERPAATLAEFLGEVAAPPMLPDRHPAPEAVPDPEVAAGAIKAGEPTG